MGLIEKSDFRIERMTKHHLELVRYWRNQRFVREQMEFNKIISSEAQKQWFERIHVLESEEYYIFSANGIPVGLVHLSAIHPENGEANVGLFIGNEHFIGTGIALQASMFILIRAFSDLGLKRIIAKVKNSNLEAIQYNELLGFSFQGVLNENFSLYELNAVDYKKRVNLFKRLLRD
ncbi:MAG: UDP-4-amino-4,6-dideoxy-N-acetyl-beta-L-altrosamine N-acetyltransferase [Bacteroidota bacterium]|jgi:RimJ/RimL family protein N-acetyltransferase